MSDESWEALRERVTAIERWIPREMTPEEYLQLIVDFRAFSRRRERRARFWQGVLLETVKWLVIMLMGGVLWLAWNGGKMLFPHLR